MSQADVTPTHVLRALCVSVEDIQYGVPLKPTCHDGTQINNGDRSVGKRAKGNAYEDLIDSSRTYSTRRFR